MMGIKLSLLHEFPMAHSFPNFPTFISSSLCLKPYLPPIYLKSRIVLKLLSSFLNFFISFVLLNYQLFESHYRRICAVLAPHIALVSLLTQLS